VAAKSLVVDDFARAGLFEPLGSGTVRFDLRHVRISFADPNFFSVQLTKTDGASNIITGPRHPINISMDWRSTDYMRLLSRRTERLRIVISEPGP
jgi:hypothetical protein